MIAFKQKNFFLAPDGSVITGAQVMAQKAAAGGTAKEALKKVGSDQAAANARALAARQAERMRNKANPGAAAAKATFNKVGIVQGAKNTFRNASTAGKAGMVAGAAGVGLLAAKGVASMFKKKDKDKE